jgi:hypothetical protein
MAFVQFSLHPATLLADAIFLSVYCLMPTKIGGGEIQSSSE